MRRYALAAAVLLAFFGTACNDATEDQSVLQASLAGANEVPPRPTGATGTAGFLVEGTTVSYSIEVGGITNITGAHIHRGGAGVNGPIVVSLFPGGRTNFTTATAAVSGILGQGSFTAAEVQVGTFDQLLSDMRSGNAYANVHTTAFPGGEIRGQVRVVE